ncbi:hypothetical protein AgCh_036397 [Apium graveolens]
MLEEEEEELFEINLDVTDKMPALDYSYWENDTDFTAMSATTSAGNKFALLANCMLPVSDLSSAVPMASTLTAGSPDIIIVAATDSIYIIPKLLHFLL